MAGEIASAFVSLLPSARGFGPALESETEGPIGSAAKKGAKIFAAAFVAGTAVIGASIAEAMEQQKDTGRMAAALGLTPGESKELGKVAGNLYANAYGESFGEVTDAVGAVRSSIEGMANASSGEIEKVTAKALDFAGAFEVDVARSSQVAGQLITTGLAKDATQAFDLITAASQRVPANIREDVIDAADEYGQFFSQLGFSGEQAFAVLVDGSEKGMYGIDKAGDAIKEFTIRATDMSTASQEAYAAIGLNAGQMANDILAGGDKASAATQSIIDGLLALGPGTEQANTAIALFGTPLEDLSVTEIPQFLKSLKGGSDAMAGFEGASERMGKALNDNAATNLTQFKRTITQAFVETIGGAVLPKLTDLTRSLATNVWPALESAVAIMRDHLAPIFIVVRDKLVEFGTAVADLARRAAPAFESVVAALAPLGGFLADLAVDAIADGFNLLMDAMDPVGDAFEWIGDMAEKYPTVFGAVAAAAVGVAAALTAWKIVIGTIAAATKIWTAVQGAFNTVMALNPIGAIALAVVALVAAFVYAWKNSETFRNIVTGAWNKIKEVTVIAFTAVRDFVVGIWDWIKTATMTVFNSIKAVIEGALGAIRSVISFYLNGFKLVWSTIFGAIKAGVELYLNGIKLYIGAVVGAIKGIFNGMRTIVGTVVGFFISIKDGAVGKFTELVTWVTGLPGRVISALGNVGTLLLDVGKDIMNGLWDGLKAVWDDVAGWLNDVTDWIPFEKGPPARDKVLLRPAGEQVMDGFLGGLRSRETALRGLLGDYTDLVGGTSIAGPRVGVPALGTLASSAAAGSPTSLTIDYDRLADALAARPNVLSVGYRDAATLVQVGGDALVSLA